MARTAQSKHCRSLPLRKSKRLGLLSQGRPLRKSQRPGLLSQGLHLLLKNSVTMINERKTGCCITSLHILDGRVGQHQQKPGGGLEMIGIRVRQDTIFHNLLPSSQLERPVARLELSFQNNETLLHKSSLTPRKGVMHDDLKQPALSKSRFQHRRLMATRKPALLGSNKKNTHFGIIPRSLDQEIELKTLRPFHQSSRRTTPTQSKRWLEISRPQGLKPQGKQN